MIVYRLSKSSYSNYLSGAGAQKWGGRWNSLGVPMLYTSQSRALCTAEIAVHTPMGNLPDDYFLISIEIPGHSILILKPDQYPKDWRAIPPAKSTRKLGDQFIKAKKYLSMKVPSVVVPGEFNFLLNPNHPRFKEVKIVSKEPFDFDTRLFLR